MRDRSVVLGLFSLMLVTATCMACAHAPAVEPRPMISVAMLVDQNRRAVEISAFCPAPKTGSGVLLDGKRVITALHVVNCAPNPAHDTASGYTSAVSVLVEGSRGELRLAIVKAISVERDLARLELVEDLRFVPPAEIGDASAEGTVCLSPAWPKRVRSCGPVWALRGFLTDGSPRRLDMGLYHGAVTVPGNSGSGVYDEWGRVVAIVTRCNSSDCDTPNGGHASILGDWTVSP